MDKTFHIDGDFLQEDKRMKRPFAGNYVNVPNRQTVFDTDLKEYSAHIASLARYPLAPGSEWVKKEGITQADFYIACMHCENGLPIEGHMATDHAYPTTVELLPPPVAEERTLLDSIKEVMGCTCPEIYKSRGMAAPDCAECNYAEDIATHLQKRFNITKK